MNVSLNWLSTLLNHALDAEDVAHRLAMLGEPVEQMIPMHQELRDVVIGVVTRVDRHPNADRLSLCVVDDGTSEVEVVCGAPNVSAGRKYPYAPVGSTLPGGSTLKRRKIRGVQSNGMLCSASELALGTDSDGILELTTDAEPGTPLLDVLPLADTLLDVEVTPNRPDLLSHRGVARDLAAVLGATVKLETIPGAPDRTQPPRRVETTGSVGPATVSIEDASGCPRYMAAVIRGVTVGPSPAWLDARLRAVGQRPINNVVDATNFILQELGQPMHAFDLRKLRGPAIVVRRVGQGERFVTLDGVERVLEPHMTMICDAERPTAIGGVMGGAASEVTSETVDVLLECAAFDPKRIRATRIALDMSTDASYRYERGTDVQGMTEALRRAVGLIIAVAGGEEPDPPIDVYPKPLRATTVFLRPSRVAKLLGVEVPPPEIESILTRLGFPVAPKDGRLAVEAPGWRPDVTREEDLIEEIARVRGYDTFEGELSPYRPSTVPNDPGEEAARHLRTVLTAYGLHEARSMPLGPAPPSGGVAVLNPLSADETVLRADLLTGLTRAVETNWAVRERGVRLFEIGTVFEPSDDGRLPREQVRVAGVVTGPRRAPHWTDGAKSVDFDIWDVKTMFEEVTGLVGAPGKLVASSARYELHDPDDRVRGWAGEIAVDRPPWAAPVYGFEVDFVREVKPATKYRPLPMTPPVERDLALVLPPEVTAGAVDEVVRAVAGRRLESARVFDEFRAENLSGRSVAWRLVFRSPDRTLRDEEIDKVIAKILKTLEEQLGVRRRET